MKQRQTIKASTAPRLHKPHTIRQFPQFHMNATLHAPASVTVPLSHDHEVETSLSGIGRVVVGFNCIQRGLTLAHRDGYEVLEHPSFLVTTIEHEGQAITPSDTQISELQSAMYAYARRNGPNDTEWFDIAD